MSFSLSHTPEQFTSFEEKGIVYRLHEVIDAAAVFDGGYIGGDWNATPPVAPETPPQRAEQTASANPLPNEAAPQLVANPGQNDDMLLRARALRDQAYRDGAAA